MHNTWDYEGLSLDEYEEFETECGHCGETFKRGDDRAEVYDPAAPEHTARSKTVHAEPCATDLINHEGWEIA